MLNPKHPHPFYSPLPQGEGLGVRMLIVFILFIIFITRTELMAEAKLMQVPAAIHIASTISDGKFSISEIVNIAKQNGMKIVILTDRDYQNWEYGLWPLRNIIKKRVETNSVFKYGIKRYLKDIEKVQKENPDMVIIPGVESAPFYYWEGNPLANNLKIYNWHKHMLIIGMEKESDYKHLPLVSNRNSLILPFSFKDIFYLWPIIILIIGILCLRKKRFNYTDAEGHFLGPYSLAWQIFGSILIVFSLLLLFEYFPFRSFKFDQYHGDQGVLPYQNLIDYVTQKGGLIFWAHPDIANITERGKVGIETREHSQDLLNTRDYTGFAVFYEGYKNVGRPGGIWDEILKEYCDGKRKSSVWAIGGLAYDQGEGEGGGLSFLMQDLRTILMVPKLTKAEALKALKEGRMYVALGGKHVRLDEFSAQLDGNKTLIRISGRRDDGKLDKVTVNLIRNGEIIKIFEVPGPFNIEYQDDYFVPGKKIYYRLEIQNPGQLVSNPVFVEFK